MKLWKAYWLILVGSLIGVIYWNNYRKHSDKTRLFRLGKTIIEGCMLIVTAMFMPAMLIMFGSMAATNIIADKYPTLRDKTALWSLIMFGVGTTLLVASAWILEIPVMIGVLGVSLITEDVISVYRERRLKRLFRRASEVA